MVNYKSLQATPVPSQQTLERFIARVEQNAHVEAIEEFYAEHASMQENQSPPRSVPVYSYKVKVLF
jgi:hypothetical protein